MCCVNGWLPACCDSLCSQAGSFQALQQRDGERAGRPGPRGLPGAQHRRANAGQEPPVRLLLPKALVRAGIGEPVHRVPPHRPHTGTVGLQRGRRAFVMACKAAFLRPRLFSDDFSVCFLSVLHKNEVWFDCAVSYVTFAPRLDT